MSASKSHKLNPTILREYDIRGIVPKTLNSEDVHVIGRVFGSMLLERGGQTVAVGYDGRLSSPELEAALVEGLAGSGVDVIRIGLGPSPMLYFATETLPTDAGVMITGSHNPPDYNGLKMTVGSKPFFSEDIHQLGIRAEAGDYVYGEGNVSNKTIISDYVSRLLLDFEPCDGLPAKVAWDPGNGAAGEALKILTEGLPGSHILLNEEIDGTFPSHHPDPTVESNLNQLKEIVAEHRCDLGIAFDGDGDRIGVIDSGGRVLWGDQLLVILAAEVIDEHPGATIIADVKASSVFFDEIARMGGKPLMWKTGHSHIKNKMIETGALLAGEMSAHIFFKHRYYGFDDALYVAIRLLSALNRTGDSLASVIDRLPVMMNTPELRFDCSESRKFEVVDEVHSRLRDIDGITVNDIDGVRVQTEDGWWLLRASNTQAVLVARCESTNSKGLKRLKNQLRMQLSESGIEPLDLD
jgi:phosphomannomutase